MRNREALRVADTVLPILMYHGLHASVRAHGIYDPVYSVAPDQFERQLDWLATHGYRTTLLHDAEAASETAPSVVITFDDGDVSNAELALPALAERGMVAEFFVTADFVGQDGRMTPEHLRALVAAGMGVQSHGYSHRYLADLDEADLEFELAESKRRLEAIVGTPVLALALPGGRGGERERVAALRLGYRDLLNSEPGPNCKRVRGDYLQRLAVTHDLPLSDFARLVQWRGLLPRARQARYRALAVAKHLLGNQPYERFRKRLLER